jgi:two-component sensor histidine kinase
LTGVDGSQSSDSDEPNQRVGMAATGVVFRQTILIGELNHRVKNTLAIVQGLATLTRRHAATAKDFTQAFDGRLRAMAKSHDLLSAQNWTDCDLRSLVVQSCAGFGNDRISITGDEVPLTPNAAIKLSLILHELCTNATKYGALSKENGSISIGWHFEATSRHLSFTWQEQGAEPVAVQQRKGFGLELISILVEHDLRGTIDISWSAPGICVQIKIPPENTVSTPAASMLEPARDGCRGEVDRSLAGVGRLGAECQ